MAFSFGKAMQHHDKCFSTGKALLHEPDNEDNTPTTPPLWQQRQRQQQLWQQLRQQQQQDEGESRSTAVTTVTWNEDACNESTIPLLYIKPNTLTTAQYQENPAEVSLSSHPFSLVSGAGDDRSPASKADWPQGAPASDTPTPGLASERAHDVQPTNAPFADSRNRQLASQPARDTRTPGLASERAHNI